MKGLTTHEFVTLEGARIREKNLNKELSEEADIVRMIMGGVPADDQRNPSEKTLPGACFEICGTRSTRDGDIESRNISERSVTNYATDRDQRKGNTSSASYGEKETGYILKEDRDQQTTTKLSEKTKYFSERGDISELDVSVTGSENRIPASGDVTRNDDRETMGTTTQSIDDLISRYERQAVKSAAT